MSNEQGGTRTLVWQLTDVSVVLGFSIAPATESGKGPVVTFKTMPVRDHAYGVDWSNHLKLNGIVPRPVEFHVKMSINGGMQIHYVEGVVETQEVEAYLRVLAPLGAKILEYFTAKYTSLPSEEEYDAMADRLITQVCDHLLKQEPSVEIRPGFIELVGLVEDDFLVEAKENGADDIEALSEILNEDDLPAARYLYGPIKDGSVRVHAQYFPICEPFATYFNAANAIFLRRAIGRRERQAIGTYQRDLRRTATTHLANAMRLEESFGPSIPAQNP